MPEDLNTTRGQPQVGSDDLLVPFETLPLGSRIKYPGGNQVWTVLSKFRDNQDERLSGTLAEWRSDMGTLGYWPGQTIVSHLPADCPEMVIFVD